jgi:hypothetical protein
MSESGHKKKSGQSNDGLTPEPPEILRKLLWLRLYGCKHWKLILLAVLCLFVLFILTKPFSFFPSNPRETNQQASGDSKTLPQTFNFVDFEDAKLRQAIQESTSLKFDMSNNVTYTIRFAHTGSLRPASKEGNYLFDGGVLVVLVNESICCEIPEIKLQSWSDDPGNPKDILETKIKEKLKQKISEHRESVAECLIKCFRNEK